MPYRLAAPMIVLAALALLVAGCGSDGQDVERLSRAQFVAQTNAVCKDFDARFQALAAPTGPDGRAAYVRKSATIAKEYVASLRALAPPSDVEERVDEAYDALEEELTHFGELAEAEAANDQARAGEIRSTLDALNAKVAPVTKELGLTECAS